MFVFVYGTLKKNFCNHILLQDGLSKFRGTLATQPEYTMFNLGKFPGIVRQGTTCINGEVYEVNKDTLEALDMLEGYPALYTRETIPTPWGNAWIYILSPQYLYQAGFPLEKDSVIEGGKWK